MVYKIVPMLPEHIDGIVSIENECFSNPWTKEGFAAEIENGGSHFYVALADFPIGYIGVQEVCNEAYITNLAVPKEFRGRGIGRALLGEAISGARERDNDFITLEVRQSNEAAISLYMSFGFVEVGKRRDFYRNPTENALLYTLTFKKEHE